MRAALQDATTSLGLLILRLGTGGYMLTHGIPKLQKLLAGEYGALGDPIGIGEAPSLVLMVTAEVLCSVLVMTGAATRLAAIPPVIGMCVAAFVTHAADPWTAQKAAMLFKAGQAESWSSKQPALMFAIPFLALVFTGAGRFSVDGRFRRNRVVVVPS